MDDSIITIYDFGWKMTINLKELAASAGIRKKLRKANGGEYEETVPSVPIPRARRLLRLIRTYGTMQDFAACDKYLAGNTRLRKIWEEIK